MTMTVGQNTVSGQMLQSFVDRIERVREEKKQLQADESSIFAEAKAQGFNPPTIRAVLKVRAMKPADYDDARDLLDSYLHAVGMAREAPLFRSVGLMSVDIHARESVIEAFKRLVPVKGEIIVKIGKDPVVLTRDKDGTAIVRDYHEPKPAPAGAPSVMPERTPPDCTEAEAEAMGAEAYGGNQPITANPFPWNDPRRACFDRGWRSASGSDGMGEED